MKIEKKKLLDATKKLNLFVSKNAIMPPVVHFRNENGKATIFATDLANAARVHFETNENEELDFCINFDQLVQATKIRSKDFTVNKFIDRKNENGESHSGIEFFDDKTKFVFAMKDASVFEEMEHACSIPSVNPVLFNGKNLKESIRCSGYARNEKETQNIGFTGIKFINDENNNVTFISTDRTRIAAKSEPNVLAVESNPTDGIIPPKTIASVNFFEDDEEVKLYITDKAIVLISNEFETYSTKINANFPDVSKFFATDVEDEYKIEPKDFSESISIVKDKNTRDICLEFFENRIHLYTIVDVGTILEDEISCQRTKGNNDKKVWVNPKFFEDILSNLPDCDAEFFIQFRKDIPAVAYQKGSAYGMIAPLRK